MRIALSLGLSRLERIGCKSVLTDETGNHYH